MSHTSQIIHSGTLMIYSVKSVTSSVKEKFKVITFLSHGTL